MPGPYHIHAGDCAGPIDSPGPFDSLDDAIRAACAMQRPSNCVDILGDGYDADCDQDGYYLCSDGLDDDERDRVQDALYVDRVIYEAAGRARSAGMRGMESALDAVRGTW